MEQSFWTDPVQTVAAQLAQTYFQTNAETENFDPATFVFPFENGTECIVVGVGRIPFSRVEQVIELLKVDLGGFILPPPSTTKCLRCGGSGREPTTTP